MDIFEKMDPENFVCLADYIDDDGYICCGKCRTRKQYLADWPSFDGSGKSIKKMVPVACKCEQERRAKEEAERAEREHRDNVARMQSVCFKSSARREHTFENATMVDPEVLAMAKDFVENWDTVKKENTGYLFWGDCGTSKSYTAACIANALMELEVPVLMRNMGDFLNASFEDREELCRDLSRYGLVIFDDLGMERGTEYGLEMVFRAINARCESGKPTIITTNLSLKELTNPADMDHKRIYDRVMEMCVPIHFKGQSVRPQIHQHKKSIFKSIFNKEGN